METVNGGADATVAVTCTVSSFGFKYGMPQADWVIDVRFLRNPYWEPALRPLSGLDQPVRDYVLGQEAAQELLARLNDLLPWVLGRYAAHGRGDVHIAIGCTGGRHRSVAIADALAARLAGNGAAVELHHRDVHQPGAVVAGPSAGPTPG